MCNTCLFVTIKYKKERSQSVDRLQELFKIDQIGVDDVSTKHDSSKHIQSLKNDTNNSTFVSVTFEIESHLQNIAECQVLLQGLINTH